MSDGEADTPQEIVDRAELLVELRRPEEALKLLAEAIAQDPDSYYAWCVKSLAHIRLQDYSAALDAASTAATLSPEDEWSHQLACIALLNLPCRAQDAIAAARQAVRLGPEEWRSHYLLGIALMDHRRHRAEAVSASERVLELAPDEPDAHVLAGDIAILRKKKKLARQHFERALALDPESFEAHDGLARMRLNLRGLPLPSRYAEAAGGYATGLRTDPDIKETRHNLDLALRTGIAWAAYFLFLIGWFGARIAANVDSIAARVIPVATLLLPAIFVIRFVQALRPEVRAHLYLECRRGLIALALASAGIAVACVVGGAVAPQEHRQILAVLAAVSALLARIALWNEGRNRQEMLDAGG